jgi:protein-tyrosine phosphatase
MMPELYWIRDVSPLRLAQMARPRSGEWLRDEITGWQRAGIDTVVSLLEPHEVQELALKDEASLCAELGIEFLAFPIADRGTPRSLPDTLALVDRLVDRLRSDKGVGIHCRAGIGRSGLISACVLVRLGVPFAEVFSMLSRARKVPVPDTSAQIDWVQRYAATARRHDEQA